MFANTECNRFVWSQLARQKLVTMGKVSSLHGRRMINTPLDITVDVLMRSIIMKIMILESTKDCARNTVIMIDAKMNGVVIQHMRLFHTA